MGNIITHLALPCPPCSYDLTLSYLKFIYVSDDYIIPIRYYNWNDALPTMIMCHANGEDISNLNVEKLSYLYNVNIITFDYAGYGLHSCRIPSEENCYKDVIAVYYYLKSKNIANIIIYSRSIGTGVAAHLAFHLCQHHIPCKLILVSAFKTVMTTILNIWTPFDLFLTYLIAPMITCPTLVINGCHDPVTDCKRSYELSQLFPNAQFVDIANAGHDNVFKFHSYDRAITNFIHD